MALVMDGIAEEDGAGYCRLQETGRLWRKRIKRAGRKDLQEKKICCIVGLTFVN